MDKNNAYCVGVDTFQFNAGIIGFIFAMEANDKVKGVDYDYDESNLYISREMIANEDMTEIYFNAVIEKYGAKSIVTKFLDSDFDDMSLQQMKEFDGWKSSDKKGKKEKIDKTSNYLKDKELINIEFSKIIEGFTEEKDEILKREKGKILFNKINENSKVKQCLLLADIFKKKFSVLFKNFAFLKYHSQSKNYSILYGEPFKDVIYKWVFKPLKENITIKKKGDTFAGKCLNCNRYISSYSKPKADSQLYAKADLYINNEIPKAIQMTYIQGVIADMSRKQSVFWGRAPDTIICPLCNMIYSFMPLGFTGIGGRALVFVNMNDSVENMRRLNEIIEFKEDRDVYWVTYNSIINKLVDLKLKYINKMQVISKDVDNHYKISDISKDKLKIIDKGHADLKSWSPYFVKPSSQKGPKRKEQKIYICEEALSNIANGTSQFNLINTLIDCEFNDSNQLFNILKLQIYKSQLYKEEVMENKVNIAYATARIGNELRRKFGSDADKELRGFTYQLLNAAHSDNNELFLDRIVRMYMGMQLPIPDIFIKGFKGTEEFKTIAYAYIIGLRGEVGKRLEGNTNED